MINHTRRVEVSELQRALAAAAAALTAEKTARRDESAAAAAEIAQLTEQLTAAEAARRSGMSDISTEDVQPDLERGETPSPLVGGAGRWSEELTLFQPWRSHTLKGLSQDSIAYWTDSHEAEFQDGMYHSGFKWRVCIMSSMAFAVCLMALVDPCLTMLAVLCCLFLLLLLWTQIAAQRMVDKRRGRQLGQRSLILICIGFACAAVPIAAQYSSSSGVMTWKGEPCRYEDPATTNPFYVINLFVAPATLFVGFMITFMTISTRCFVAMVTGSLMPVTAAYFLRDIRHRSNLS